MSATRKAFAGFIFAVVASLFLFNTAPWAAQPAREQKVEGAAAAQPQVYFPKIQYEFEPVLEGAEIKYDFVIENRGQAPLEIKNVHPD